MKRRASAPHRPISPIVAAVVRPVSKRLSEIHDLVVEMRYLDDIKLKRLDVIERRIDALTAVVSANRRAITRLRKAR
jgi:Mg2+ and Co2+ transporter CorA